MDEQLAAGAKALQNLLGTKEDLHEDLVPYLVDSRAFPGRKMLHHPLIIEVMLDPMFYAMINRRYQHKHTAMHEAMREGDWGRVIALHERPYRVDALLECIDAGLSGEEFWDHLSSVWTDSENIHEYLNTWRELWTTEEPGRNTHVMNEEERNAYAALPDMVEVWRGYTVKQALHGMSWSFDKAKAEWFARRFANMENRKPHLAHGVVAKEKVLAVFLGRNESEVVVLPEHVDVKRIDVLKKCGR